MTDCTFNRSDMLQALALCAKLVKRKTATPILGNVRLVGEGDRLHLTATDMDRQVDTHCPAMIEAAIDLTVPVHAFHDFVQRAPEDKEIRLTVVNDTAIEMRSGRARCKLLTLPSVDFHDMGPGPVDQSFAIAAADLKTAFEAVAYAQGTEETRYYLCGVSIRMREEDLEFAATDGHRLAVYRTPAPEDLDAAMPHIIVPTATVETMLKMLAAADKANEDVQISLSTEQFRLRTETATLTTKLIDGNYPDYHRIVPHDNDRLFTVPVEPLIAALDRMSVIAGGKRTVRFSFTAKRLRLHANLPELGEIDDEITTNSDGPTEKTEIGFNAAYVRAGLPEKGQVIFALAAPPSSDTSITAARIDRPDDPGLITLVMPMRI